MASMPPASTDSTAADPADPGDQADTGGSGNEVTVCIELDTSTGQFTVGMLPQGQEEGGGEGGADEEAEEAQWMKPARDINDALKQAKQLLEEPQSAGGGPSPFESGFAKVSGSPDMGGTAGGLGQ
jgi:hypothetical protein